MTEFLPQMLAYKYLTTPVGDETKVAPAVITEYILYSIAIVTITFGVLAAMFNQQGWMVVWYAQMCILAYSLITVVFFITLLTHVNNKDVLINGCVPLARNGEKDDVVIWTMGRSPAIADDE
ncbi:hypothetical protein M405DRAFT_863248 [Rhizopogon salebrosus TDB-379]|nr:hypothetical protein M405DRAFT_863248 [Rhizopogon salebrosus TDB-379]